MGPHLSEPASDGSAALASARGEAAGFWPVAAALMLIGVALRVPMLVQSLWWDETLRTRLFLDPAAGLEHRLTDRLFRDVHNPLYNAIMAGWIRVAGDSEVAIRVPSLVFAFGAAVGVAVLMRRVVSPMAGLATLAFLVFNPAHIWYSTTAKNNALVMFTVVLAVLAFDALSRGPTRRRIALATLAAVAAISTSWIALLALVPLAVLDRPRLFGGARRWPAGLIAFVVALVLASPLIVFKVGHMDQLWRPYARAFTPEELGLFLGSYLFTGNAHQPGDPVRWDLAAVASLVVVVPLLVFGWRVLRRGARAVPLVVVGVVALMTAASLVMRVMDPSRQVYQERNLILLVPLFAALVVAGALALPRRWMRVVAVGGLIASQFAASGLMLTVHRDAWTVFWPTPDWRGAAEWIRRDQSAAVDEAVVLPAMVVTNSLLEPLVYDEVRRGPLPPLRRPKSQAGELVSSLLPARSPLGGQAVIVYVISDRHWWPLTEHDRAALDARGTRTDTQHFRGLDLYRYLVAPSSSTAPSASFDSAR